MVLAELGINQDLAPVRAATKVSRQTQPTACQPADSSLPLDIGYAFPAHSTPRHDGADVPPSPADLAGQTAGQPAPAAPGAASQDILHYWRSHHDSPHARSFVPETPGAWLGASMSSYDVSTDMMLEGLHSDSFSSLLAGQPLPPGGNNASISDVARMITADDLESLLRDLPVSQDRGSDSSYSAFLKDLPPLFVTHGMAGEGGESGPPAGQPDAPSSHSEPSRPEGHDMVNAEPSRAHAPLVPESSSSGSSPNLAASHTTPDHSPESSSTGKGESPSAAALVAADESGNPFWDQIMESSFEDDDEDGQAIAEAKQAHGLANNPPPEAVDRRRPENLKIAREDIQRTGKRLLHEMKLLSDPNAVQPSSCPWSARWLQFAMKHKCTILNWPADAPWPHEIRKQLQNSVEEELVPIWRAFTTQNPALAVRVELWSKDAIQDPLKHNPPLIVRPDGQLWTYRDEEHRSRDSDDDDAEHHSGPPASTRKKHDEEASRPAQRPKARHAARKAHQAIINPSPSALVSQPDVPRGGNGELGPAGQAAELQNGLHSNTLKRKISDILESPEEDLPSAQEAAFEQDNGGWPAQRTDDQRKPEPPRSNPSPAGLHQSRRALSPPAGRNEPGTYPWPARINQSDLDTDHEQPYIGRTMPQGWGHGPPYIRHRVESARPATRAPSPSAGRRADHTDPVPVFPGQEQEALHERRYPPPRDAPSMRSQGHAYDHDWYAASRPASSGRIAIPRPDEGVIAPSHYQGMGSTDNGRYSQMTAYPHVQYPYPPPRPMPPPTAEASPRHPPPTWTRNVSPTPQGRYYGIATSRGDPR
ncbi:hypothetical protein CALCODRAFT_531701 [Calocera cornea HHB12733]|uniref:Uncharacterized protein n=1 Tax=Calocera cornea HHB12733 TaxID=1353952 RepID=A0A165D6J7_9BASI|nr:hypothetical protein CALCODRAFT_531701 [Calocera cornea HHB12733]